MTTEQWRQTYERDGTVDLFLNDDFNAGAKLIVSINSRQQCTQQQQQQGMCSSACMQLMVAEHGVWEPVAAQLLEQWSGGSISLSLIGLWHLLLTRLSGWKGSGDVH